MSELFVSTRTEDNHAVMALVGELTMMNSQLFTDKIAELVHKHHEYKIIVEVDKLKAVDSCGIGAMVSAYKAVSSRNGYIYLVNPQAGLMETLYVTKLDKVFPFFKSVGEAIEKALEVHAGEPQGVVDDVEPQAGVVAEIDTETPQPEENAASDEVGDSPLEQQAPEHGPEQDSPGEPEFAPADGTDVSEPVTVAEPADVNGEAVMETQEKELPELPETQSETESPVVMEIVEPVADPLQPAVTLQEEPARDVHEQQPEEEKPEVRFKLNFPGPADIPKQPDVAEEEAKPEPEEKPDEKPEKKPKFKHNFPYGDLTPDDENN